MDELFVGREHELERLRAAADDAVGGQRRVVMLAGEAGIGKTRAVQELEEYALEQGAMVLWGRSRESAGAPPYWPWVQASRVLGDVYDDEMLRTLLGPEIVEAQRIFPELRNLFPDLVPLPVLFDGAATQFRLFEAVTALYRRASAQQPIVLVLEDLHWADRPTLLMLGHVAAELRDARMLFVSTYRDAEVSVDHPLAAVLAELNRESGFESVALGGLSDDEVARYIQAVSGLEPSWRVVSGIHELTEGNPFFAQQVVSLMSPATVAGEDSLQEIGLPDGVRAVLSQRLARLTADARELLTLAAVAGREFTYGLLTLLDSPSDDDALLRVLEEGISVRVIEEMGEAGRFRFVHALMRETLLAEVSTTRRARMHGRVGEALERRWGAEAEQYASRLAAHFVESAAMDRTHVERALRYSQVAGQRAEQETAWEDAAAHYERALALVWEVGGELSEPEPELLMGLGRCQREADAADEGWGSLVRAISICRERGDAVGQARATLEASRIFAPAERVVALVREALAVLGTRDPHLEARLHAELLRQIRRYHESDAETRAHRARAGELAEEHGYEDVKAAVAHGDMVTAEEAGDHELAVQHGREAHQRFDAVGMPSWAADALHRTGSNALRGGQLAIANDLAVAARGYSRHFHLRVWEEVSTGLLASIHLLRTEFAELASLLLEYPGELSHRLANARVESKLPAGDVAGAREQLPPAHYSATSPFEEAMICSLRVLVELADGDRDAAEREFRVMNEVNAANPGARDAAGWLYTNDAVSTLGEAFVELGEPSVLRAWFDSEPDRAPFVRSDSPLLTYGLVGVALGEHERASEALEELLAITRREGTPIIEGRCHEGLAEVAAARGEHHAALAELKAAAACFEPHGAVVLLDRVAARRAELQGSAGAKRGPDGLSAREVEVLRLLADGKSNRAIADQLVLSIRTVERHIANIYAKTDTHNRVQATAYALRLSLD